MWTGLLKRTVMITDKKSRRIFEFIRIYLLMAFYCHNYNGLCLSITLDNELTKGICYDNT